jgi:hypothetical protein
LPPVADGKLAIVTGASENHARPLFNLLSSIDHHEPGIGLVVYDLGLGAGSLARLHREGRAVVPFRFADYPPHVGAEQLRTYAWKPALVRETLARLGPPLLYLDAGDLVHARLDRVRAELARAGFYAPRGAGTIEQWCHPATLAALRVEPEIREARNRNAAVVGVDDNALGREIVEEWYRLAMRPEIICPPGATKAGGHRFDQSILSVLVERARLRHGLTPEDDLLDVSHHHDDATPERAAERMRMSAPEARREVIYRDRGAAARKSRATKKGKNKKRRVARVLSRLKKLVRRAKRPRLRK